MNDAVVTEKDKVDLILRSFGSLMKPFLSLFPEGGIAWEINEEGKAVFEGRFTQIGRGEVDMEIEK